MNGIVIISIMCVVVLICRKRVMDFVVNYQVNLAVVLCGVTLCELRSSHSGGLPS